MGTPGQIDYGCANGALDGLAAYKRASSNACVSLQWGPWARGMAARAKKNGSSSAACPYGPLDDGDALNFFDLLLRRLNALESPTPSVCAVVRFDLDALSQTLATEPGMGLGTLSTTTTHEQPAAPSKGAETVLEVAARHTSPASPPATPATPVSALGLDSLDAMALVRDLNRATGASLSVVDVLGAATLGDVAALCPREASSTDAPAAARMTVAVAAPSTKSDGYDSFDFDLAAEDRVELAFESHSSRKAAPGKTRIEELAEPSLMRRLLFTALAQLIGARDRAGINARRRF